TLFARLQDLGGIASSGPDDSIHDTQLGLPSGAANDLVQVAGPSPVDRDLSHGRTRHICRDHSYLVLDAVIPGLAATDRYHAIKNGLRRRERRVRLGIGLRSPGAPEKDDTA